MQTTQTMPVRAVFSRNRAKHMANKAYRIVGKFIAQSLQRSMARNQIAAGVQHMLEGRAHPCVLQEIVSEVLRGPLPDRSGSSGTPKVGRLGVLRPDEYERRQRARQAARRARHQNRRAASPRVRGNGNLDPW